MRELDAEAKSAGIIVMNEIGLDPGIDHLYAIKTIDEVHAKGGKVRTYTKWLWIKITILDRSNNLFLTVVGFRHLNVPAILSDTSFLGLLEVFS